MPKFGNWKENLRHECGMLASSTSLATRYVLASTSRSKGRACVGVCTVALVVAFAALLQATIAHAPFIFLKLAQDTVGQNDIVYLAQSSNTSSSFLVNYTDVEEALAGNPDVAGTAPRWVLLADLLNPDDSDLNSTVIMLIIDSELEEEAGIGTQWDRRPLGEDEAYITQTGLDEIAVQGAAGERAVLSIDVAQLLESLVYGPDLDLSQGFTEESVRNTLDNLGVSLDPITLSASDALTTFLEALGINSDNVPSGLGEATIEAELLLAIALNATFGAQLEESNSIVIQREVTVVDGVSDPKGKYPTGLGNVAVLEAKHMVSWVRGTFTDALDTVETLASVLGLGQEWNDAVEPLRDTLNDLTYRLMKQYAMQVIVMYTDRVDTYTQDIPAIKAGMKDFSDSLMDSLGVQYPVEVEAPVAATLEGTQFISLFLNQIFTGTLFLLLVLGSMVIYALVLGNVDSKTYEYGMLRVLGLRHGTLAILLIIQTLVFSVPGIAVGLIVAAALNVGVSTAVSDFAGLDADTTLPGAAILYAVLVGSLMPSLANIVPIRRALSSTLRDAIDLYHQTFSDVKVIMLKLSKMGLSPWQFALAVLMVMVGFTTFFLIPLSFVLQDFGLFLSILNIILLGMVLGLSFVATAVQSVVEKAVLWLLLWRSDTKLWTVITKNLAGHKGRNSKSAYMITIAVAFLVFAGAMFALQAQSLKDNVRVFIGSDLMLQDLTRDVEGLPQESLIAFLDDSKDSTDGVDATVEAYTFVTHPLDRLDNTYRIRRTNLATQPNPRGRIYGLQENYLEVCYDELAVVTAAQSASDENNIVAKLHQEAGEIVLPIERDRTTPESVLTGVNEPYYFLCNVTQDLARQALVDDSTAVYSTSAACEAACFDPCVAATYAPSDATVASDLSTAYRQYVDVIVSEATRPLAALSTTTPVRLSVATDAEYFGTTLYRERVYLAKARGFVSKMPGFFFSTYRPTGWGSPVLVRMQSYAQMASDIQTDVALILQGEGTEDLRSDEDAEDESGGIGGTGSPVDNSESSNTGSSTGTGNTNTPDGRQAEVGTPTWVSSQTGWVFDNNTSPSDAVHPATFAFDNNGATHAFFPAPAPPATIFLDLTECLAVDGIRINGAAEVNTITSWQMEAGATPDGPFQTISTVTDVELTPGLYRPFKFLGYSSQYWRLTLLTTPAGAPAGVSVADIQLSVGASSLCDADLLLEDDLSIGVSKRRVHIRMVDGATDDTAERIINSLRNIVDTDITAITDTKQILADTDEVAVGLQAFFTFVSALCLVLIFFATWLSFDSNLRENSREFGILRSLGLSKSRVTRVYLYEAMAVVLSSFTLGTFIGLLVAITLTLQFNLFTEQPFNFEFPTLLFFFTFSVSVVVSIASSLVPAFAFSRLGISNVVKGRTS